MVLPSSSNVHLLLTNLILHALSGYVSAILKSLMGLFFILSLRKPHLEQFLEPW